MLKKRLTLPIREPRSDVLLPLAASTFTITQSPPLSASCSSHLVHSKTNERIRRCIFAAMCVSGRTLIPLSNFQLQYPGQ